MAAYRCANGHTVYGYPGKELRCAPWCGWVGVAPPASPASATRPGSLAAGLAAGGFILAWWFVKTFAVISIWILAIVAAMVWGTMVGIAGAIGSTIALYANVVFVKRIWNKH